MFISWEPKDEYIFWPAMITVIIMSFSSIEIFFSPPIIPYQLCLYQGFQKSVFYILFAFLT